MTSIKFDSEGFDLDAAVSSIDLSTAAAAATEKDDTTTPTTSNDVIYEIGGTTTTTTTTTNGGTPTVASSSSSLGTLTDEQNSVNPIIPIAEEWKEKGNDDYKKKDYPSAYEKYTAAIRTMEEAKGSTDHHAQWITGQEILQKKDLWEQEQQLRLRNELRQRDSNNNNDGSSTTTTAATTTTEPPQQDQQEEEGEKSLPQFVLDPPHPYGTLLATYYCNRAAASMQIATSDSNAGTTKPQPSPPSTTSSSSWYDTDDTSQHPVHPKDQDALQDCTIAILLNPNYTKAYIRRATIYEQRFHRKTDLALADMLTAQRIEPHNRTISTSVRRLQQLEQQRMDQLKEETMAKLKDLGNSILGNFGLSLDNFKTQQDPNTGSYNISFSQN